MTDIEKLNGKSYMELCRKFPYTSSRGSKYILVVYNQNSNLNEGITLKTTNAKEITEKWKILNEKITKNTISMKFWIVDKNEASKYLKEALKIDDQTYQLIPPHIHRINAAERAIRTYKSHLIAGLATCDSNFPITEWDRMIEQGNIIY